MMLSSLALLAVWALGSIHSTIALGTSCSAAVTTGTAAAGDPFWLESMTHQGTSAFNSDPSSYAVYRNVKDYGAVGDGVTDDTAAINAAISDGDRCAGSSASCNSSTVTPAVVFFPQGTYLVSSPIIAYYFTQLIGDGRVPPTLLASASFSGIAVIDADPYLAGGANWYINTDNFFRSVRNFVIDLTEMPSTSSATGLHWQVSQSTSLMNIVVNMSTESGNSHQGIFMENGSGGYMGDLVFNGGKYGIWVGNQQFTVRNISVSNAATAIFSDWNWGWTFQGVTITDCSIGFDLNSGGTTEATQTTGAVAIIDAVVSNTPIFIQNTEPSNGALAGSVVINNAKLTNVPTAVSVASGTVVLEGSSGTTTIESWGQGNVYSGTSATGTFTQGTIASASKPSVLLDSAGRIFQKTHPQYANYAASQFISVKSNGAKGDGSTDDTAALQTILNEWSGCKIIFFDAGTYIVTDTLKIPAGTQMVGEAWTVIAGKGSNFQNVDSPIPVIQVGTSGSTGVTEITDFIFKTIGYTPGAIIVEWNAAEPSGTQGGVSAWDTHIILGGATGTDLETSECPAGSDNTGTCVAAFMGLHLTSGSTAYIEGMWVWLADHDLDGDGFSQLTIFSGRGIYSQSQGPVWLIGTAAEHHVLYQYHLDGAANHYMGLIQTETPYYQPSPAPPAPFSIDSTYSDPSFASDSSAAWGLYVQSSTDIIVFGAGHYSFYINYGQDCLTTVNCQAQIVNVDSASSITIYSLATVGVTSQLSVSETGIIPSSSNPDGFQDTVTVWSQ